MKTIAIILSALLYSANLYANSDRQWVYETIFQNQQNPQSKLNQQLQSLKEVNKVPPAAQFSLYDSSFLWDGNHQRLLDCKSQPQCVLHERHFYKQMAELRQTVQRGSVSRIALWPIVIHASVYRSWESNSAGEAVKLRTEKLSLHAVTLATQK